MKLHSILLAAGLLMAQSAFAETHIFLVDNSDGYGIDRCLASGEACGKAAAATICHSREYAKAIDFGRLDRADIAGSIPHGTQANVCTGHSCPDMIAIICSR